VLPEIRGRGRARLRFPRRHRAQLQRGPAGSDRPCGRAHHPQRGRGGPCRARADAGQDGRALPAHPRPFPA
jgi:hypothetical protein